MVEKSQPNTQELGTACAQGQYFGDFYFPSLSLQSIEDILQYLLKQEWSILRTTLTDAKFQLAMKWLW